jgi:molecular chaperone HscB
MIECPSCRARQEPRLTCATCAAPLGAELDLFAALGLDRKLTVDTSSLERTYHDLSRKVHPDRFASAPPAVRDASLRSAALLTRAYRTLRDPVQRGLYWLELNGEKLAEDNKRVPPAIAELVFDVQEQLAELRSAHTANGLAEQVRERRNDLQSAMSGMRDELEHNFVAWDASGDRGDDRGGDRDTLTAQLKDVLARIAYLRTLIRDVDRELEQSNAV